MFVRIRPQRRTVALVMCALAILGATLVFTFGDRTAHGDPAPLRTLASAIDRGSDEIRVWRSETECEEVVALDRRLSRAPGTARVASWNVRWFPDNTVDPDDGLEVGTNQDWLSCAMSWLDADVIAVQEFRTHERGRKLARELLQRLNARTGGNWQLELDRCGDEDRDSHVGFLYDANRAIIEPTRTLEGLSPEWGCRGDFVRGLARYFRFAGGLDTHLVALHLQWGTERGQLERRRRAYDRINEIWASLQKIVADSDVMFLGDFNTSGCDDCYPHLSWRAEVAELDRKLERRNPRFRLLESRPACTEYYDNVATAIDHVAVHAGMAEIPERATVEVYGSCRALACRDLHADSPFSRFLNQISDHCPIVLTLPDRDQD